MKEKYLKTISLVLIVINTIAMFLLVGMPKDHTNRYHFTDHEIRPHYDAVYAPRQDMTLTDSHGNNVYVTRESRIGTQKDNIDSIEYGKEEKWYSIFLIEPSYIYLDLTIEDLYDYNRFEDITEQVRQEGKVISEQENEEGLKKFNRYMRKERLWFLFPWDYIPYYIFGAVAALLAFALWFSVYKREKYYFVSVCLIILSIVKIAGIVYYYANPSFCR